ncbi:hypothetical protein MC378_08620 [Polaribacter sp. MSW13]|uniref:Uncharacterized protein n=1 Tax=Polaribacter marinus TaxID=2916838 RepID=A0A9X2AK79_9FLAO|nr:hypothetical protein [Polaribacter marinus]MCI2229228.1 hypothetical protein [Polaribacter marinus]
MSKKSNTALEDILEKKEDYTDEAIQAAIWELENRGVIKKTEVAFEDKEFIENKFSTKTLNENPVEELQMSVLYSKKAIQGFTIFFTTIFGAVLLMSNLKELNKSKARIEVLVFGISYTLLSIVLLNFLPRMFLITLLFNFVGYLILVEFFWNKNLGKDLKYKKKEIWKPLITSILITGVLIFLQFLPQILSK